MDIVVKCGYCSQSFSFTYQGRVTAPARGFDKVSCPHCGSRLALDLGVRKVGKSAKMKRRETDQQEKINKLARELYSETSDSVVKSFDQLEHWEKNTWEGRAFSELRKKGEGL